MTGEAAELARLAAERELGAQHERAKQDAEHRAENARLLALDADVRARTLADTAAALEHRAWQRQADVAYHAARMAELAHATAARDTQTASIERHTALLEQVVAATTPPPSPVRWPAPPDDLDATDLDQRFVESVAIEAACRRLGFGGDSTTLYTGPVRDGTAPFYALVLDGGTLVRIETGDSKLAALRAVRGALEDEAARRDAARAGG